MTLDEIRAELPVLEHTAYLNAGTFGPLPRAAAEALERWTERSLAEGRAGHAFFEEVLAMRVRLREELAALIGGDPAGIALTTSTTEGCNTVVAGLRLGRGDEVVTTDAEHPGLIGALRAWGLDVRLAEVSQAPAAEAADVIERALTPQTKLIAVSHVIWTTGQLIPVERLAGHGVPVLVDGAQSAGAIPVDVGALGCDFYTVSGQKWLCGPDATGALYVRPDRIESLAMTYPSYFAWASFDWEPQPDARRFESSWTPPGSLAGLLAALAFARSVGEERFERGRAAAERCRELVAERAEVVTEPDQATLVSFVPRSPAGEVVARLAEQGVVVRDLGPGWVRASCGFWTSEEDLERLRDGLAEVRSG
jgi:L-cysteine/cystine lyase